MNLMMLLEMATSGFGERIALQGSGQAFRYAELFSAAGAASRIVAESGAAHLALLDVSTPALPTSLFASAWAGVPFVPLNYRLTGRELDALLEQIAPALLVTDAERAAQIRVPGVQTLSRDELLSRARADVPAEPAWGMDGDAIAILLFTSGTTGAPKAAVIRHRHIVSYILGSVEFGAADERDAAIVSVPPYHIAAMAAIASSVYLGRRIVQLPSFTPESWIELARRERISHAFVVPTMLKRIVDALEGQPGAGLPELRALSYGGGKMPLPVIEKAMQLFPNTDFTNAYGLTETSSTIAVLGPEDHRAAARSSDPHVRRRLASVGRPLPNLEIEIRDAEGKPLPAGSHGEICVRGEQVSGEYLGRASRTGADGFFPTADGGFVDDEGFLYLEGRIDDVIVRGGENMSPGEIEDVLIAHPAVGDAAVVGLPDEQWGEAVAAAVVLKQGRQASAGELRDFVKQHLRSSRTPERIEFWSELPYTETGKLLRRSVRERFAAGGP